MTKNTRAVLGRQVCVQATLLGEDIDVLIYGGDAPHMGGVAMAVPYLSAGSRPSAFLSSLSIPGHKDEVLWRSIAKMLAVEFDKRVVVSGGVHFDSLDADDLLTASEAIETLALDAVRVEMGSQG